MITAEEFEYFVTEIKLTITAGSNHPVLTQAQLLNNSFTTKELLNMLKAEVRTLRKENKNLQQALRKAVREKEDFSQQTMFKK